MPPFDKYSDVLPAVQKRERDGRFHERYGEKLESDEIRRLETDLGKIQRAFTRWRRGNSWYYRTARDLVEDLDPEPRAVHEFCDDADLHGMDGKFLSALINTSSKQSFMLPDLSGVESVGARNAGKRIVVEGDVGPHAADRMEAGTLTVQGDAESYAGSCMAGGELTVEGDAAFGLGKKMTGGTIRVEGDATPHSDIRGGELVLGSTGRTIRTKKRVERAEPRIDGHLNRVSARLGDRCAAPGIGPVLEGLVTGIDLPATIVEGPLHHGKDPSGRSHQNHFSLSKKTAERARYVRNREDRDGHGLKYVALGAVFPLLLLAPAAVATVWTAASILALLNYVDRKRTRGY